MWLCFALQWDPPLQPTLPVFNFMFQFVTKMHCCAISVHWAITTACGLLVRDGVSALQSYANINKSTRQMLIFSSDQMFQ